MVLPSHLNAIHSCSIEVNEGFMLFLQPHKHTKYDPLINIIYKPMDGKSTP